MSKIIAAVAVFAIAGLAAADAAQVETRTEMVKESPTNPHLRKLSGEKIAFRVGDKRFVVNLYDNPTARDLLARLPITVRASNYPGYDEKVLRLAKGLSMEGAPKSDDPGIPEVGYYEPGQWIALYYGPIGNWPGKVPLGQIGATVDELRAIPDGASLTIERGGT